MKNILDKFEIKNVKFKNRLLTASGTFNLDSASYDPSALGAVTTKGVNLEGKEGNPLPRIAETDSGILNCVGLENGGVENYIRTELKELKEKGVTVISNFFGSSISEYVEVATRLDESDTDLLEMNISCPNIKEGGISFGTDKTAVLELTKKVKQEIKKPLIVKLSPNVTDIQEIALSAVEGGADALSLINTLLGMRFDIKTGDPILSNTYGGLSGPAVKPIALRMVHQVRAVTDVPIIGIGGIMNKDDAKEFFFAGADLVGVGTASLRDPHAMTKLLK